MTPPIELLPNLGPRSSHWLREVGVATLAELQRRVPVVVYRLVKQRQPRASLNLPWALAAATRGIDGRDLPAATKQRPRKELADD